MKQVFIVKRSGERELFSEAKLRRSLEKAMAEPPTVNEIVRHIRIELKDGMTTSEIYNHAFELLKRSHAPMAARYSLKQAIMDLGPEGHNFERFVGELLKSKGFAVHVGKVVKGYCVSHEVDVVGEKKDYNIMVECKFHNSLGIKSDIKVALYVQARFEDIGRHWKTQPEHSEKFHEAWLVTNTKLTSDAIGYASCMAMKTIGWGYPEQDSLERLIEQSGLHPLTCLTTLRNIQKRRLLDQGAILCRGLVGKAELLKSAGVAEDDVPKVMDEIARLCQIPNMDTD